MSGDENNSNIPSNEKIVDDVTKGLNTDTPDPDNCDETAVEFSNLDIEDICEESDSSSDCLKTEIPDEEPPQNLTNEEILINHKEALNFKLQGNDKFKEEQFIESVDLYTKALRICPLNYSEDRSILFANRAAAKAKLARNESAVEDCTKALELNDKYLKAYLRRAKLYEETSKLDESLEDYKKILELDPRQKDAQEAQIRLPSKINERNEAMKAEMFGKMKDLGNVLLRPFGLSTENFQINQDPNTGSYSINFKQNSS